MLLGEQGVLYYLGTGARASWGSATAGVCSAAAPAALVAIGDVVDLKINMGKTKVPAAKRNSGGVQTFVGALRDLGASFKLQYNPSDPGQQAMLQAYAQSGIYVALAILDQTKTTSGAFGVWCDYEVFKMEKTEDLEGVQQWDVEVAPSAFSNVPGQIVTVP